ncbi:hypothetical protein LAT59_02655 [Candidatus Gracilibacteria bacterium]|nr:hypothetical protein [Candidatus Gracilibacteria bacterium]
MKKIFFRVQIIIFLNLFAFLMLGHILDAIFEREVLWKLICLGISFLVLGVIMYFHILPLMKQIQDIKEENNGS